MTAAAVKKEEFALRYGTVRIVGQNIRYAEYGPADAAETLLIFNGIGGNIEAVEAFMMTFSEYRVISFDAPGVGDSPTPPLPYRLSTITRLAARLLDHLDVETTHVFGVSWGGTAAQQFARDYQERCKTLTLAATAAGLVMVPGARSVLMKMLTPQRHADPNFMLKHGAKLYGGLVRGNSEILEEFSDALRHSTPLGYVYQMLAIWGRTSFGYLPAIKIPSLVLMGEDDPIVPVINGKIIAKRLANAELKIMPCGHLFMVTMPVETAHEVETFIAAHT